MIDKFAILKWLLSNSTVLREIGHIVSGWSDTLTLAQKLEIVYLIAKAVLPVIETFPLLQAQALSESEQEEVVATAQAEYGIPVPILLSVVAPIVSALIQVMINRRNHQ
jgi:hypothetical protein